MHVTNIKKDQFFETQTFYTRIPGKFKKVGKILLPENFSLTKVTKETVVKPQCSVPLWSSHACPFPRIFFHTSR